MSYNYGLRPGVTQKIATSATAASSSAVGSQCQYLRLIATQDCHVKFGTSTAQGVATMNGAISGAATITIDTVVPGLAPITVGQVVTGTGISSLITVASITSATVIVLSGNVSVSNDVVLTFSDTAVTAATANDMFVSAEEFEIFKVSPNTKVSVIRSGSTDGSLFITEMTG